ncbi:hypothetical protein DSL72_008968 [Monilinia vaccinii-corymbosi]|uniref:DUF7918 domain-containing protein n=1 Tax=Monilinia vaccinii-corymbosi TaxID=61207 RepID=A0A8A3PQV0_9HELO|nr:hypothetical protein DSL72_008968 [Monilinia vaccinii-corymbosi]
MAVRYGDEGEIVVRVKRYKGQCYDEHVKLASREKLNEKDLERYIVADPGATYYIIVGLNNAFDFSDYTLLRANVYIDDREAAYLDFKPPPNKTKLQGGVREKIEYANVDIGGQAYGSRFVFGGIDAGRTTGKEIKKKGIPTIKICFDFRKTTTKTLSNYEYNKAMSTWREARANIRPVSDQPLRSKTSTECHPLCKFVFHCISAEALEEAGIAKYPPPPYLYHWDLLNNSERKLAFDQLQNLEINHLKGVQENGTGQASGVRDLRRREALAKEIRELRSWGKLYNHEQREVFEILQERRKARERGKVDFQYHNMKGEVVNFGEEAQLDGPAEASPREDSSATMPIKPKMEVKESMDPFEERPAASLLKASTEAKVIKESTPNKDKPATVKVKKEPPEVISFDSDDEIILVSEKEWQASKTKKTAGPEQLIKQEVVEPVNEGSQERPKVKLEQDLSGDDEQFQRTQRWKELEKEKAAIQLNMELLKNEKRLNEINEELEAAKTKRRRLE